MRLVIYILLFVAVPLWGEDKLSPERVDTLIAVFNRLDPAVVDGNAKLKDTLTKLLDATRDDPRFVGLVKKFKVAGRNQDLLVVAAKHPNAEAGVEALQLVLNSGGHEAILRALHDKDNKLATGLADALANNSNPKSIKLLTSLVIEQNVSAPVRKAAVRGLSRTEKGAKQILAWAKTGKLPANARELNSRSPHRALSLDSSGLKYTMRFVSDSQIQRQSSVRGEQWQILRPLIRLTMSS